MRMLRTLTVLSALAATCLIVAGASQSGTEGEGGTFRVGLPASSVESVDPFLNNLAGMQGVFDAVCASLLRRRDEPLPAGSELAPELAEDFPEVSNHGKAYTFRVRRGYRFSTGEAVTVRDVAATVRRALKLKGSYRASDLIGVVGARAFSRGRAKVLPGVIVKGNEITFRLKTPRPDFASVAGGLCVFPQDLPLDHEGARAPWPSAGPYTLTEYVPGRRIMVERNRFYRGPRPQHVDRFDITLVVNDSTLVDDVEQGTYDYAWIAPPVMSPHVTRLVARYGVNRQRFFATPGRGISMLVLNASRPLFRNNPNLRRAVNFAIDRKALVREAGPRFSVPGDQYLQPHQLAYRDARIYPFTPNLSKARELARGNRRGGKLVFYTRDQPLGYAYGAIVRANLAKIGLDVEVKAFPTLLTFDLLPKRGEPFDIGWIAWNNSPPDALNLHAFFDGRTLDDPEHFNWSHFNSPRVNRRLDEASRLSGPSFYRAYGKLDAELARDFAPAVTFSYLNDLTLVSARTACVVNRPFFDLGAACIR